MNTLHNIQNHIVPRRVREAMQEELEKAITWTPHKYQEWCLKLLLEKAQSGLLLDPGMGKTSSALAAYKIRLQKKQVKRVLVVCTLRAVYEVWPQEVVKWKDFHNYNVVILHGNDKDKILRQLRPEHNLVLINPEGLQWLLAKKERLKLLDADALVIDESSKFKNQRSVRFRALKRYLQLFKYRNIMTGSPRPKNYMDLWSQIFLLDQGATLGVYITTYRMNYFYPAGYQLREWALIPDADKKINKVVAPLVMRLDATDYLKLPKLDPQRHYVELPSKAQKTYDQIEKTLMSTLFDGPLTNSAAARSKLCQIANGRVYADLEHKRTEIVHSAKVEALVELIEELQGDPILVSIGYHHDVEAICEALGYKVPTLNSNTTHTQSSTILRAWDAGDLPVLLGHPASMGHGLNMQKCNAKHVAFFDIPDDYDLYDQLFRRVWRQGNKSEFVMEHMFISRSTVDVAKIANLKRKGTGQNQFLNAMREYTEQKYGTMFNRRKTK